MIAVIARLYRNCVDTVTSDNAVKALRLDEALKEKTNKSVEIRRALYMAQVEA